MSLLLAADRVGLSPKKATKNTKDKVTVTTISIFFMKIIKNCLIRKFQEGMMLAALICPLASDFWETEVFNLPQKNRTQLILAIQPAHLDTHRRSQLAELLAQINPQTEAIQKKLFV